ncbi:MAG: SH3 domain-containing protein [Caldilineaceae bacterium]|nr:SH3 domain-containing protein [Caldilineaceae bacterium]
MQQRPQQVLRQLIRHYGAGLHADPRRVEALLQDLCGQYQREIFVLVHAQEQQIPHELLNGGALARDPAHWQRLSRRLQDRLAMTADAADWAVQSWAMALNVTPAHYRYPRSIRFLVERLRQIDLTPLGAGMARLFNWRRRSFVESGVQWERQSRGWIESRRWVAPALLALLFFGIIVILAQPNPTAVLGRTFSFWQHEELDAESALLSAQISGWLEQLYPLPRAVRIGEEPVAVRAEPAFETSILALLTPPGASVIVDAYTADGRWAHISEPIAGWIEQDGVTQILPAEGSPTGNPIVIMPMAGRITGNGLRVRQSPTVESAILYSLNTGDRVLVLAATQDRSWLQIVDPVQGWVSADFFTEDKP